MKKSNFLKVGIVIGSALMSVPVVYGDSTGATAPTSSSQSGSAPALGASWSAPVKTPAFLQNTVMHLKSTTGPVLPPPPPPPVKGQVALQTNIMCGDQDVNNFHGGVNPVAPATSKNVQFLDPSANGSKPTVQLVFGYWVVPQTTVSSVEAAITAAAGKPISNAVTNPMVPGEAGGPTWYPLAFDTMAVASATKTPQPTINQLNAINKNDGPVNFSKLITQGTGNVLSGLGGGSFKMPKGPAAKYAVYFDLMACNPPTSPLSGTNANKNLPDSLEIANLLAWMSGRTHCRL